MADANPYAKFATPAAPAQPPPAAEKPAPDKGYFGGMADRAAQPIDEATKQIAADWATAYAPAPPEPAKPLDAKASATDKVLHWWATLGGTKQNPGGEKAAAADRLSGDIYKVLNSVAKGYTRALTNVPSDVYEAVMDTLMMAAGPRDFPEDGLTGEVATHIKDRVSRLPPATTPQAKAARRLITQGKLNSKDALTAAREHQAVGAGDPTLLDVMDPPAQRVVRAAGAKLGDADTVLEQHRRKTRGDVAARAVQRTEVESPQAGKSIDERKGELEKTQSDLAREKYREPYAQPIETDDRLFDILNSPSSFQAIGEARMTARERALDDPEASRQYHELTSLREYFDKRAAYEKAHAEWESGPKGEFTKPIDPNMQKILDAPNQPESVKQQIREALGWKGMPEPQPPERPQVSGGSLDRIRIALREKGRSLGDRAGKRDRGAGVGARSKALDEYLDDVPHLKEARAEYRDYSKRIEQLDFDKDLSTMRPEAFKKHLADLSPEQKSELIHSVTERLSAKFGKSSRGAQTTEDVLTTGYNAQANLRSLLGKDVADRYLRAIDLIGQGVDKANFVASRVGSQSRMVDEDIAQTGAKVGSSILLGRHHSAVHEAMNFFYRHTSGLQPEEARQIAEWATQQKDVEATLREIAEAAAPDVPTKGGAGPKASKLPPNIRALLPVVGAASAAGQGGAAPQSSPPKAAEKPAKKIDSGNPYQRFAPSGPSSPEMGPQDISWRTDPGGYLQNALGVPVRVTSTRRSAEHNAEVGGVSNSAHLKGEAIDFVPEGMSMHAAASKIVDSGIQFDQIEITPTHVHISFAPAMRGQVIYGGSSSAPQREAGALDEMDSELAGVLQ